ncbi:MAG: tetratricopeptide repeat protein [Betaproteobacteria bacterium]
MLIANLSRELRQSVLLCLVCFSAACLAGPVEDTKDATKLYQQGKLDQALSKVNGALAQQPKDAQGRFLKGLILTEMKKGADAIQVFAGLTEDYPELPEPYNNLAVLYASQGNYDKAKAALELAIHTHPSYATAYENLGDIYAQLARRSYDKVLQLDKSNVTAQSKLSMVKDIFNLPKSIATDPTKTAPVQVAVAPKIEPKADPAKSVTPTPTKVASVPVSGNATADVKATVESWAKAWAAKDMAAYLAFYAPEFETPAGMSRASWEEQRKERIVPKKSISVDVKINKTSLQGNTATVVFRQVYRADTVKSDNTKTLRLVKTGDRWLITAERSGS